MCYKQIKVKAVSPNAPKKAFVPCGDCEDCRISSRNSWAFRLMAEMEDCRKKGWKIGFATLTYRQCCLPHIPECLFDNSEEYRRIPCFSRQDVSDFIVNIRRKLWKMFRTKAVKYMVCGEYGGVTHRPHYHMIISWNPIVEVVDKNDGVVYTKELCTSAVVHKLIKKYWKFGWIIPYMLEGGVDSKGREHKPFEVRDTGFFAAKYAAKYCCKDIDFYSAIDGVKLNEKSKLFKKCRPFHIQSRSLGFNLLKSATHEEKVNLLLKGKSFVGVDKVLPLPVYLKNKLIFDINYQFDISTKKRLVRREANAFFVQHHKEIYDKKAKFYTQLVQDCCQAGYFHSRGYDDDYSLLCSRSILAGVARSGLSARDLAEDYLSYYGVDFKRSFNAPRSLQWLSRYYQGVFPDDYEQIPYSYWNYIQDFFGMLFSCLSGTAPRDNSDFYEINNYKHRLQTGD